MLEYFFCLISGSLLLYSRMALVTLGEKKGTKIGGAANQSLERLHHKTVHALSGALLKGQMCHLKIADNKIWGGSRRWQTLGTGFGAQIWRIKFWILP